MDPVVQESIEIIQQFVDKHYFENVCQTIIECHWCAIGIYEGQLLPYHDNWELLSHDEDCPVIRAVKFLRDRGVWPAWEQPS